MDPASEKPARLPKNVRLMVTNHTIPKAPRVRTNGRVTNTPHTVVCTFVDHSKVYPYNSTKRGWNAA